MSKTREQRKQEIRWWIVALALYLGTAGTAFLAARWQTERLRSEAEDANRALQIAVGERKNAEESARQWKAMYDESLREIAALKAENEELTRAFEETSFALDEVCWETGWTSLGTFQLTFYCPCEHCCGKYASGYTATGTLATEGRTVAVDPSVIPLGSEVKINGHVYIAEDTGVHGRVIDVFVDDHDEALRLGTYRADVEWRTA